VRQVAHVMCQSVFGNVTEYLYIAPNVAVQQQEDDEIMSAIKVKNKAKMYRRQLRKKELVTIDSKDNISCISIVITCCFAVFIHAIKDYHAERRGRIQTIAHNKTPEGIEAASRKKARQNSERGGIDHNGNHSVTQSHNGGRTPNHRVTSNLRIEVDDESESASDVDTTKDMKFDGKAKVGWTQKLLQSDKVCCTLLLSFFHVIIMPVCCFIFRCEVRWQYLLIVFVVVLCY
jgi:hypothetical protein